MPALSAPAASSAPVGAGDVSSRRARRPERVPGGRAWLIAAVCLIFAATVLQARHLWTDGYYALYAGKYIVAHGIPHANVVTVVAHGAPWIDQQWLAQVLYYGVWAAGGYAALVVASSVLVTAGFGVLAALMLGRGLPPARVFGWTLAAFSVSYGYAAARPQSFGFLFLALTLWFILRDAPAPLPGLVPPVLGPRADPVPGSASVPPPPAPALGPRGRTWLVIVVLVAWANTHGSVLLGVGLVAVYVGYRAVRALVARTGGDTPGHASIDASGRAGGDRRRRALLSAARYLGLGVAAVASVAATPYGVGVIGYYRDLIGNSVLVHNVAEWAPPDWRDPLSWAFFAVLAAVAALVAIAWRRGAAPDPLLLAIAAFTLALALTAFRNVPWFGFGASLLAADTLARYSPRGAQRLLGTPQTPMARNPPQEGPRERAEGESARANRKVRVPALGTTFRAATVGLLAVLAAVSLVNVAATSARSFEAWIPRRAIDVGAALAARHRSWRVLDDQWSAVGMLWLHPSMFGRVGFDVRVEQYPLANMSAFFDFLDVRGPGWQRVIKGYDLIVVSRYWHADLARALASLPGWRVAYIDRDGLVLIRR